MDASAFAWSAPPRVVGHRGAPREAPENTVASFLLAAREGAGGVELDARLTRDGHVVVHHDAELGRTVAAEGVVERMTLAQLEGLDAGSLFSSAYAGEPVPTLERVLRKLPSHLLVDLELKADADNAALLPAAALDVVRRCDALERVLATSFDPALADAYARLSGRPAGAILPFAPEEEDLDAHPRLRWLALADDAAEDEALALARRKGVQVLVWTVDDPERARALLEKGVAGVITDRPGALVRAWGGASAP